MKIFLRQFSRLKLLGLVVTLSLFFPFYTQAASLVNLGTLDVKLVTGEEHLSLDLTPGQSVQEQLRVSNFSSDPMHLQIYVADAAEDPAQNFIANDKNQLSIDLAPWVSLPTQQLDLAPGTSKILSVNIQTPNNAGIGLHTGAIMVSQKVASGENADNNILLEKGVRIYANIKGAAVPAINLDHELTTRSDRFLTYSAQLSNSGNTDLSGAYIFKLLDQNNQVVGSQQQQIYLKPGETQSLDLAVEKPLFGVYHAQLSNNLINKQIIEKDLGAQIFLPPYSLPIFLGLSLLLGALLLSKKKIVIPKLRFSRPNIFKFPRRLALEKIAIFSAILLIAGLIAFNVNKLSGTFLKANVIGSTQSYQTTIKWGNLAQNNLPDSLRTDWQGSVKFENAIISIKDYLHQEATDQFIINSDQNSIFFKNATGPDNDGVELIVTPTSTDPVKIVYKNSISNEEIIFPLEYTLKQTKSFDFKAHQITFSSVTTDAIAENIIVEQDATGEISNLQSSEEVTPVFKNNQLADEVKILQGVITDLPSSPEILSQYILNSDYVHEVNSENQMTTIRASSSLINALLDSPNIIADITSSRELNYIFVPDQKVRFLPQEFSFTEDKTVMQSLGEIIFVQNKTNQWNTYLSITNLVSVSGRGSIPISNITIIPGDIKIISGNNLSNMIQAGEPKSPSQAGESILLTNVSPQGSQEAIFSLNPQFKIHIPSGTPPGVYRAQITIKVL